jgi:glyoxylase-like metal-dependent hydrolase (beta-lactamase superfamily II)
MVNEIHTIPLKVPCYLVKTGSGFLLIDTGDSSDCANLVKALSQAGVTPEDLKLVLLTHGDFDHAGNAAFLQKKYGTKVAMHTEDMEMVKRGDQGWNRKARADRVTLFGKIIIFISSKFVKPGSFHLFSPDLLVNDGDDLSEYGFEAKVLHLPAHSKGSIGILSAEGDLFCGDLLMNMFRPEPHFMIDDMAGFHASIEKLKTCKIKTFYPGHGKPFPIAYIPRLSLGQGK